MARHVLISWYAHNVAMRSIMIMDMDEFEKCFEIYRKDGTPKVYKDHHVRLTEEGLDLDEECFYRYILFEARSGWPLGPFKEGVELVGHYIWNTGRPGEDYYCELP